MPVLRDTLIEKRFARRLRRPQHQNARFQRPPATTSKHAADDDLSPVRVSARILRISAERLEAARQVNQVTALAKLLAFDSAYVISASITRSPADAESLAIPVIRRNLI